MGPDTDMGISRTARNISTISTDGVATVVNGEKRSELRKRRCVNRTKLGRNAYLSSQKKGKGAVTEWGQYGIISETECVECSIAYNTVADFHSP